LIEKNNLFLGVCFQKQFLPARPKNGKLPTKPFKNAWNLELNAFIPFIPAPFSHFSELTLVVT
jgi:hypothetical protein